MKNLRFLLLGLFCITVLGFGGYFYLLPSKYTLSGTVVDKNNNGVEGVVIKSDVIETKTDTSGRYSLKGLKKEEALDIVVPENYEKPILSIDYNEASKLGFKKYNLKKDLRIEQSVFGFSKELLTNQKFKKHNIIWEFLDEPSQQVYGSVNAYESFWKAYLNFFNEQALRDFEIDKENITHRDKWGSPQGIEYQDVYEVPIQETLNDGTTHSDIQYVFKVGEKWKVTTSLTKEKYKEAWDALKELGVIE